MDFEIWQYPHIETQSTEQDTEEPSETVHAQIPDEDPQEEALPLIPELSLHEQEHIARTQELNEHINMLRDIKHELSTQLDEINNTLLISITKLVRKITEAVILKEIDLDKERLPHMVTHALSQIQQDHEPCTIYLSPEQHTYFSSHSTMPAEVTIKPDPTLKQGDFRVKTAYSELESNLEKRLNELFEL